MTTVNVLQVLCPGCDLRRPPATMHAGLCDVCRSRGKTLKRQRIKKIIQDSIRLEEAKPIDLIDVPHREGCMCAGTHCNSPLLHHLKSHEVKPL